MCAGWWLLVGGLMDVRRLVAVGGLLRHATRALDGWGGLQVGLRDGGAA